MKKLSKKLLLSGLAALTIYSGFNTIDISTTYAKVNYDVFDLEAHHGGRDVRPENTLYSYAYAIELGATSIECDMQLTKDGQIVMSHNPILNSDITRDENGNYIENNKYDIRLMTVDELKKFDVGIMDPNCGEYYDLHGKTQFTYDAKIPTLEEVLEFIKDTDLTLNIEIKNNKVRYKNIEKDILDIVKQYEMEDKVVISSFNYKSLKRISKLNSKVKTAYLVGPLTFKRRNLKKILKICKDCKCTYIHPSCDVVNKEFVAEAHKKGFLVQVYTVNSVTIMKKLIKLKVDGVFTNYPKIINTLVNG